MKRTEVGDAVDQAGSKVEIVSAGSLLHTRRSPAEKASAARDSSSIQQVDHCRAAAPSRLPDTRVRKRSRGRREWELVEEKPVDGCECKAPLSLLPYYYLHKPGHLSMARNFADARQAPGSTHFPSLPDDLGLVQLISVLLLSRPGRVDSTAQKAWSIGLMIVITLPRVIIHRIPEVLECSHPSHLLATRITAR